jgi:hypothetical protein
MVILQKYMGLLEGKIDNMEGIITKVIIPNVNAQH